MDRQDWLAERFEEHRPHLRAVAYRLLGSPNEVDDASQGAWLRLSRADPSGVDNLGGWLTTLVARECLDLLRARSSRREQPLGVNLPDRLGRRAAGLDPEQETLLAEGVGLALLVVLDTLAPAERLAFVLHDMFAVPFEEIAAIVGRSPAAARQLASRARRRVRGAARSSDADRTRQRKLVDAFLAAARAGDFDALVEVLDPDVVFRVDTGGRWGRPPVEGAAAVAREVLSRGAPFAPRARPAIVNGAAGAVVPGRDRLGAAVRFTIVGGRIAAIDLVADPDKLRTIAL